MRVCILTYDTADPGNIADDIPADPTPYLDGHDVTTVLLDKPTAVRRLEQLAPQWDCHDAVTDLLPRCLSPVAFP